MLEYNPKLGVKALSACANLSLSWTSSKFLQEDNNKSEADDDNSDADDNNSDKDNNMTTKVKKQMLVITFPHFFFFKKQASLRKQCYMKNWILTEMQ